ncbi:FMN-dependent NADH-azoreductase [Silvanigrella paludirubra]|uniref:FMN dependent NADH:quinone oxidoreductase n=1 Tax=Silvanigrella paludirubra TaxID=2499159 RepID=A0A6N6VUI1_9BACT|nr:NAD(P)H-dependent oxidoreductase [Silvanigrella paludirubra]KAB8039514.1 FMN-dependent NADH-azoreductase [Silvanigrella paludirubra]
MTKKILIIQSSPRENDSITNNLIQKIEDKIVKKHKNAIITYKNLSKNPLPHPTNETISAYFTPKEMLTDELNSAINLSNKLTDELLDSNIVIVGAPMWNFSIPSSLKAWLDHIVRVGKTFSKDDNGYFGLAENKKAIIIIASGGVYSNSSIDFNEPYLRFIFNFIGISDIQIIKAEGLSYPNKRENALKNADIMIDNLIL